MLQIIVLILGIVALIQLPGKKRRKLEDYPNVDAEAFSKWQNADLKYTYALLFAGWGVFVIQLVLGLIFGAMAESSHNQNIQFVGIGVSFFIFLVALIYAAALGSGVERLRKSAGIAKGK